MNYALFTNLLTAHFLADFPLQLDVWVQDKKAKHLLGYGIWLHSLVVLGLTWLALGKFNLWLAAVLITVLHVLIDYAKVRFTRNGPRAFALDQILHIIVLIAFTIFDSRCGEWQQWAVIPQGKELLYPALVCVYLFCLSPANYIIREVLSYCHISETDNSGTVRRSGMLIGSAERFLVLTCILVGNFEAAGLIVAAKSLLRFNDDERLRTEYVLVGTLLSIIVAVVSALIIFKFVLHLSIIKFQ